MRFDMDILDEKLLENIDDTTVKSLNGCRVTARILQLVPKIEPLKMQRIVYLMSG
jgi:poly(A) polymerase